MIFLECNIDIVRRISPQWVYDYLEPGLLIFLAFILLALFFGFCVLAYKELYD